MTLAHSFVGPGDARRTIVLVHGLLASGRNLRSLARALTEALPDTRALLVDLPGHGDSSKLGESDRVISVRGCADAVAALLQTTQSNVHTVIGHSFGGKVALLLAHQLAGCERVWTLDTRLDTDPNWRGQSDVATVMAALRSVPVPAADRKAVATALADHGLSDRVAEWLTTNLKRSDAGFTWVFDFDQIEGLTDDYFHLDAIAFLEARGFGPDVHLLRAENGDRWTPHALARVEALSQSQSDARVHCHVLTDAGHWVHADNLPGLLKLLLESP